jgi:hypothetical protein
LDIEREHFVRERLQRDFEGETEVAEKKEGIFNECLLTIIINRITTL